MVASSRSFAYLVVGSGLFGAVFAQRVREHGRSVLVLERRRHIGGNCHSFVDEASGAIVHTYGTHVFHTSNLRVWNYIQRFASFTQYRHRARSVHAGRIYPIPINLDTINGFFGLSLSPAQARAFLAARCQRIERPTNLEEQALGLVGPELYQAFIAGYTRKHWGCDPRQLPPGIVTRLPVRASYDDSYYDDRYQGVPAEGYTPLFARLLEGIPVELGVDFMEDADRWRTRARTVVYTGPLDRYFGYRLGRLGWRSVHHTLEHPPVADYQGIAQMHFPDPAVPWTRIHEPRHLHPERRTSEQCTAILREVPGDDPENPSYPLHRAEDRALYQEYARLAAAEPGLIVGGRLGRYQYYDMHQVVASALAEAARALQRPEEVVL